jgi:hypothetical protein
MHIFTENNNTWQIHDIEVVLEMKQICSLQLKILFYGKELKNQIYYF